MTPGEVVQARRTELGISRAELARRAEVDPKTVQSLEQDARWPLDVNRARIEAALGWAPGSLDAIRNGNEPVLLVVDQETTSSQTPTDKTSRRPEPVLPNLDDVLALNQIRSSVRIIAHLPAPVQAVVLAQAREHLDTVVDFLDEERVQELVLEAYRLLDEQMDDTEQPAVHVWDAKHGPGPSAHFPDSRPHVVPLGYVADSSPDEPEMGDDGYHDGP